MKPRIRTVKPEALTDEVLWDLEVSSGLPLYRAYQGLWMCADREGRFEWRPRVLKLHCLPYWEGNFEEALEALAAKLFIVRYTVEGKDYGYVRTLAKHQRFDHREPPSVLPAPSDHARACPGDVEQPASACPGGARVEGKGREGNGTEGERKGTRPERASAPTLVFDDATTLHRAVAELTEPATHTRIPESWAPSEEFYGEALGAGVTREFLDEDVTYWRGRKLGGEWFTIEQFFRAHFPRLAKRRETESFKASRRSDPDDRLQRQADRVKMLREQEAAEERRAAGGGA